MYLVLFSTRGDLSTLAHYALSSELTIRVVLNLLTVVAIGGSVFAYYLRDVREKTALDCDGGARASH